MRHFFLVAAAAGASPLGCLLLQSSSVMAWTTKTASTHFLSARTTRRPLHFKSQLFSSTEQNEQATAKDESTAIRASQENADDDDDDDEWEYLEYEDLQESDFVNSEWLVGTVFDNNPNKIVETWARCIMSDDSGASSQPCVWGDGSKGKWSFDRASQYFSLSKEHFYGKEIWAGTVDDYYYIQGTVRGWTYITAAEVLGQWQAKRLGVDPEEAGIAPWFEEEGEERGSDDDENSNELVANADEAAVESERATEKKKQKDHSGSSAKKEEASSEEETSKE
jgi:hypothetical protein